MYMYMKKVKERNREIAFIRKGVFMCQRVVPQSPLRTTPVYQAAKSAEVHDWISDIDSRTKLRNKLVSNLE